MWGGVFFILLVVVCGLYTLNIVISAQNDNLVKDGSMDTLGTRDWQVSRGVIKSKRAFFGSEGNSLYVVSRSTDGFVTQSKINIKPYTLYRLHVRYNLRYGTFSPRLVSTGQTDDYNAVTDTLIQTGQWLDYTRVFQVSDESVLSSDFGLLLFLNKAHVYLDDISITPINLIITAPTSESKLDSNILNVVWDDISADSYELAVGKTSGSSEYGWFGEIKDNTQNVSGLPTDGSDVFIRLFAHFGQYSISTDTHIKAYNDVAPVFEFTENIDPMSPQLLEPLAKAVISGTQTTLVWKDIGASSYDVAIGSSVASPDYGWYGDLNTSSVVVDKLPANDSMVYVRVFAHVNGTAYTYDTTFISTPETESTEDNVSVEIPPDVPSSDQQAFGLIHPDPSSILTGSTETFSWNSMGLGAHYELAIGSSIGLPDYKWYEGDTTSVSLSSLPTDGSIVYVRLLGSYNGKQQVLFYTFTAGTDSNTGEQQPDSVPTPIPDPTPTPPPIVTPPIVVPPAQDCVHNTLITGTLTALWVNDGEDKVAQGELRGTTNYCTTLNSLWNGSTISLFGAKNEVVDFNLVLESGQTTVQDVLVSFNTLTGPNGAVIASVPSIKNNIFNWVDKDIELFYVRYLEIKGLSKLSYESYDERHIPERFRRPFTGEGYGFGTWLDRPDHNAFYPDIAVPLVLEQPFAIQKGQNQSIWSDIYIPADAVPGVYTGTVAVSQNGNIVAQIPVSLTVNNFSLPDKPSAEAFAVINRSNINKRFTGDPWANIESPASQAIRDTYFQMAHRHKIDLVDDGNADGDKPLDEWIPRLDGSLYTSARGYDGPGAGMGNNIYSIGTYGSWSWKDGGEAVVQEHATAWEDWFSAHFPNTDHFLYLIDESNNFPLIDQWTTWINNSQGSGKNLKTLATLGAPDAVTKTPDLDIVASGFTVGDPQTWQSAHDNLHSAGKEMYAYNGKRPANGSFAIEDEGASLRSVPWVQYEKGIDGWFFWESTYYNNYQGGMGDTNVFEHAQTFGAYLSNDTSIGETCWNTSNGDGVLFYPGTDKVFPQESYNVMGPIASLRLKHWRRGIQDVDYITLAMKRDPVKTQQIVHKMMLKSLWDYGIDNPADPTYVRTDIAWSTNPDDWENARKALGEIIMK